MMHAAMSFVTCVLTRQLEVFQHLTQSFVDGQTTVVALINESMHH